jgi:hypothetical protein
MGVQFVGVTPEQRRHIESYLGYTVPGPLPGMVAPPPVAPPPVAPPPVAPPSRPGPEAALEEMAQALRRLLWLCADPEALRAADYYEVVGVAPDARGERIREACAVLRSLLDPLGVPDHVVPGGPGGPARFEELLLVLAQIEATLTDPARRAAYDRRRG